METSHLLASLLDKKNLDKIFNEELINTFIRTLNVFWRGKKIFGRELFPMAKDNGCSKYYGQSYYIPRTYDPKRAYPWLTNVTHLGMSSNKKQAIEVAITRPNVFLRSVYPLDKAKVSLGTNCPPIPGQVQAELAARPSPFLYTANVSLDTDGMSAGRRDFEDSCQGDTLANSHNPDKILKAKVNDVLDSENVVYAPIRNSFRKVSDGRLLRTANGEAITHNQNSAQSSGATSQVGTVEPNAHLASESNSNLGGNAKKQKACTRKKLAAASEPGPNIYPLSNQSLLSSGVFDGAPVKYTLWSRDIILHGVIKGSKILCSCNKCNNSQYISPCQFERHAGGKTKKPYSCIYLENGKSINQVCRELRATPKDMLFHRLPKVAGSAFTWLTFNNWEGQVNPEFRKAK